MNLELDFLKRLAHCLAAQFGDSCEVVIHDLTRKDLEQSIVHIENGHVSNRQAGDGASGVVLEALHSDPKTLEDRYSYLTKTDDGRTLKSSTLYLRDENGDIAYIFSMNYDLSPLMAMENTIRSMVHAESAKREDEERSETPAVITHNVTELLDLLIGQAVAAVGKPVEQMNKNDKKFVVQYLDKAGAFLITKSGDKVSSLLGISKFTLYSYMDKQQ